MTASTKYILYTPNILKIKVKDCNSGDQNEIFNGIKSTLENPNGSKDQVQNVIHIASAQETNPTGVNATEKSPVETTVKLFLPNAENKGAIKEALHLAKTYLNIQSIETFILSCNNLIHMDDLPYSHFMPIWKEAEGAKNDCNIIQLGVADFNTEQLKTLITNENVQFPPKVNQVNLADCCVIPKDLMDFAKENGVELKQHSDVPGLLLSQQYLDRFLKGLDSKEAPNPSMVESLQKLNGRIEWVVRYTVYLKTRGVLASKGYLICLSGNDN